MFSIRKRFQKWFESRLPLSDSLHLTQRNVYILPTPVGWMMVLTLLVLLVASINYQLNLGYLLTFLIGGSVLVGMHVAHNNLRGLHLNLNLSLARNSAANKVQFATENATFEVILSSTSKNVRYGIGLRLADLEDSANWTWVDVPAQGSTTLEVTGQPMPRGLHPLPTLLAETRFPLGTFRVWTVWRPAAKIWVYPAPEMQAPALPMGEPSSGEVKLSPVQASGEFDGVRSYRRGDPLKQVVWKKAAKVWGDAGEHETDATSQLISRDMQHTQAQVLYLDFSRTGCATVEASLSRLCAWVIQADQLGLTYGLRLPRLEISPAQGEAHKHQCLQALAAY